MDGRIFRALNKFYRLHDKAILCDKYLDKYTDNWNAEYALFHKNRIQIIELELNTKVLYVPFVENNLRMSINPLPLIDRITINTLDTILGIK